MRKAGNQLRITAQLDNTKNGYHFWSRTWERELNDVFAIQEEIAGVIATSLGTLARARRGGDDAKSCRSFMHVVTECWRSHLVSLLMSLHVQDHDLRGKFPENRR